MNIILYLLFSVLHAKECPTVLCKERIIEYCVQAVNDITIYTPCLPDSYCPGFDLFNMQTQSCIPGDPIKNNPLQCPIYKNEGDECDAMSPCNSKLYCKILDNKLGICEPKKDHDEDCMQIDGCNDGLICNQNRCIYLFSIEAGYQTDNNLACMSGISQNGACTEISKSIGKLPVKCEKDEDCVGTDGSMSECVCVPDDSNQAYCKLHKGDDMYLKAAELIHNGHYIDGALLMYKAANYPVFQLASSCLLKDSLQMKKHQILKETQVFCSSFIPGLFLIILYYL